MLNDHSITTIKHLYCTTTKRTDISNCKCSPKNCRGEKDEGMISPTQKRGWKETYFSSIPASRFCKLSMDTGTAQGQASSRRSQRGNNRAPPILPLCTAQGCSDLPPTTHLGGISSFASSWRQGAMAMEWFASPILSTHNTVTAPVNGLPTAISSGTQSFLALQVYWHPKATKDTICL